MIRYFSGSDQDYRNHTYGTEEEVFRSFEHAGDAPHAVGMIFTQQLDGDQFLHGNQPLHNFAMNAQRLYSRVSFVYDANYVTEVIHKALIAAIDLHELQHWHSNTRNARQEHVQLGLLLARYDQPDGRTKWMFMAAIWHGHDFLQTLMPHQLPVSIHAVSI